MTTYDQLQLQLQKGNYAPLYFLFGEEPYYIDLIADYIEQHLLDDMSREFDLTIAYGKDYERDISPLIAAARRFPMVAQHQVIIVREAQNIRNWTPLELYLKQIVPTTILVFCYKYGAPDRRRAVFANIEKNGGVMMESKKLQDYQVQKWILDYIRQYNADKQTNITIDERISALLAESIGNDLQKIVGELKRLIAGLPQGSNRIDADIVQRNIGISKDYNIFELQSAIINGDILKANRITRYFADSKQHPIQKEIIPLFNFFANLLLYLYLPREQKDERTVASILKISPYFVKDYQKAATRFSKGKTFRIIGYIRQADVRSKGFNNPSVTETEIWEELIYQIMH